MSDERCPKCGAKKSLMSGAERTRWLCNSFRAGANGYFSESEQCTEIAVIRAALRAIAPLARQVLESCAETLRSNGFRSLVIDTEKAITVAERLAREGGE